MVKKVKDHPGRPVKNIGAGYIKLRTYINVEQRLNPELYELVGQLRVSGGLNKFIFNLLDEHAKGGHPTPSHKTSTAGEADPKPQQRLQQPQEAFKEVLVGLSPIGGVNTSKTLLEALKEPTPTTNKKLTGFLARAKESA